MYVLVITNIVETEGFIYNHCLQFLTRIVIIKMVMQKGYIKLACDESKENVAIIDSACEIENRSRSNFIRTACLERARRTLKENEEENNS